MKSIQISKQSLGLIPNQNLIETQINIKILLIETYSNYCI